MADLAARAEVIKLAADLGTTPEQLSFLQPIGRAQLAELRRTISQARFAKLERRLRRLAASSKFLPMATTAKLAQTALGARLCGQVAGVLDVATAVEFAGHYRAPFLAELSLYLDPSRTAEVIAAIEARLAIEVGGQLLIRHEYLALGRLVSAAPGPVVDGVIARATPDQLLWIAFYADDSDRVDAIFAERTDGQLRELIEAAVTHELFDEALTVFTVLGADSRARLGRISTEAGEAAARGFVSAAERLAVELPPELRPVG